LAFFFICVCTSKLHPYEQSQPQLQASVEAPQVNSAEMEKKKKPEVAASPEPTPEPVSNPMWRNVIGQGNAPKLNKETEFPSLVSEAGGKSPFSFASKKTPTNAWASKTPSPAPELMAGVSKQSLSKKQAKKERLKQQQESEVKEKSKVVSEEASPSIQPTRLTNLQAVAAATTVPVSSNFQDLKKYLDKAPEISRLSLADTVTPKESPKTEMGNGSFC
jgi:hypothetical protein